VFWVAAPLAQLLHTLCCGSAIYCAIGWGFMDVNRAEDLGSHGVERTDCVKDCRNILRVAQDVTGGFVFWVAAPLAQLLHTLCCGSAIYCAIGLGF